MWGLCYLEVQTVKNAGIIGGFISDLQDVVDVLFLHFTDSTAGKGRAFSYVFFLWGLFTPPLTPFFFLILEVVFHLTL